MSFTRREFLKCGSGAAGGLVLEMMFSPLERARRLVKAEQEPLFDYYEWNQYQGSAERQGYYSESLEIEKARVWRGRIESAGDLSPGAYPGPDGVLYLPDNVLITNGFTSWGRVLGFDIKSKTVFWKQEQAISPYAGYRAPIVDRRGNLVVGGLSPIVTSLRPNGEVPWARTFGNHFAFSHFAYNPETDNVVFTTRTPRGETGLLSLAAESGEPLWHNSFGEQTTGWYPESGPTIDITNNEAFIVLGHNFENRRLVAFNLRTGEENWRSPELKGTGREHLNVAITEQGIVCPTTRGIYLIDREGHDINLEIVRNYDWISQVGVCVGKKDRERVIVCDTTEGSMAFSLESGENLWQQSDLKTARGKNRIWIGNLTFYIHSKLEVQGGGVDVIAQRIEDGEEIKKFQAVAPTRQGPLFSALSFIRNQETGILTCSTYGGYLLIVKAPLKSGDYKLFLPLIQSSH